MTGQHGISHHQSGHGEAPDPQAVLRALTPQSPAERKRAFAALLRDIIADQGQFSRPGE